MRILLTFILLFTCLTGMSYAREDATDIPPDIRKIFPNATRVGQQHDDIPVTPVYQLQQLLGYTFESVDFADFTGFSGKPINLLIGLDIDGSFVDLTVLDHSEPIFLHGLGEQSMFKFIEQYKTHNVRERFVVGRQGKNATDGTFFDGVTKATVSVLVINDTIVTSALAVARAKLDGFVAPSNKIVNPDYFKPLSFEHLVKQGFVHEHLVSWNDVNGLPQEVVDSAKENSGDEVFSHHYYAFLNLPVVGRNLLGDEEYQRLLDDLSPGELGLMVINTQGFSFISDEFIPQTTPENLRIVQSDFPLDARDIDFYSYYEPRFGVKMPRYRDIKVLRIKSQGGLGLDQPIDFALTLPYKPSFFETAEHKFVSQLQLPDNLFIENPDAITKKPEPLWIQIWKSRKPEIAITVLYLMLITAGFVFQERLVKHTRATHWIRGASLVFVLFFIGFHAQGQLSVVNIYALLLEIYEGFDIQVFLLDPVIFILWCFVFVSLFIVGRGLYCGWLCPFGALQEMMGWVATKLKIKQIRIKPEHHKRAQLIKYVLLIGLVGSAFYSLSIAEKLAEVEPFKTAITLYFVRYWPFALYAVLLLLLSLKIHKVYCRYLCPLGAGLAVLGRYPLLKKLTRRAECGSPCHLCRQKKCGIDAINKDGSIDYAECIQCLECVVTLHNPELCKIDKYKKAVVPTRVQTIDPLRN